MRHRQVHLDFHTSEAIDGIGKDFSKEDFQAALKEGHIDSITVFLKCHHGWAYHPSKANEMHLGLKFDLLKAQIDAAHEIDVKTPVYLSAGLDEKMARRHPEWLIRNKDESIARTPDFSTPGYHIMCFNSPYLDYLLAQIKEVCENYDADGIFLDIVGEFPCYCQNCMRTLRSRGLDPYDEANVKALAKEVYANYYRRVRETIDSVKPGLPVFHNSSSVVRGRRDLIFCNTHFETESLPTGPWGYDYFPISASYLRTLDIDFLGMTGKFHTEWGEFGGYKHPNALRYEVALSLMNGAKISIGDQLHPYGKMDANTYYIIGQAFGEIEPIEHYMDDVKFVADVAILSYEAVFPDNIENTKADVGANRIMLEGKYLYNVIDTEADFDDYKVLVLPDAVTLNDSLAKKLKAYTANGGKLLCTGLSGLDSNREKFLVDIGAEYVGVNKFQPSYFTPNFKIPEYKTIPHLMHSTGYEIKASGEILGNRENPFFNRTVEHFCSHMQAPTDTITAGAGMTLGKDGIYIAWDIFTDYATNGSLTPKRMVEYALDLLLGDDKTIHTNLASQGKVTLAEGNGYLVLNMLYGFTILRGSTQVIEDMITVHDTAVSIKTDKAIKRIYDAKTGNEIKFNQKGNKVDFIVNKIDCHNMIILEF